MGREEVTERHLVLKGHMVLHVLDNLLYIPAEHFPIWFLLISIKTTR